ncbi:MAG TPA: chromate transporter [Candidatus Sulfotelmatobacter sp.]|nr:chromate transporter [Candidatus Sulfotelmatobacter sp.]
MTDDPLPVLALRFAGLSLIAVGGVNALLPAIHATTVTQMHWLTPAAFNASVALAQAAPGPNLLLVPLVGWHVAGLAGAGVALLAFVVPSTLVAVAGARWLRHHQDNATVGALRRALRPVAGGLMLASAIAVWLSAVRAWPSSNAWIAAALGAIALATMLATLRWKLNPLAWIAIAAALGAIVPLR